MQTYTLGELDDRLTQLDELLFKAKTGQINIKAGEWDALEVEAEAILKTLATELGSRSGKPPQEVYEARSKVRALNEISAMASAILNFIRNPILKPMR